VVLRLHLDRVDISLYFYSVWRRTLLRPPPAPGGRRAMGSRCATARSQQYRYPDYCRRRLCCTCRRCRESNNHIHLTPYEFSRHGRQSIVLAVGPAGFDRHVAALHIAAVTQALVERAHVWCPAAGCRATEQPNHGHRRLLCVRRERPCCYSADNHNEVRAASFDHLVGAGVRTKS
jgi:hypothetical protein